jgi:hypothetical protein
MSVTFCVEGLNEDTGYNLPCPECGLSPLQASQTDDKNEDCLCMGYGGPEHLPVPQHELNVANINAHALMTMLDLDSHPCGAIQPQDLLAKLSIYGDRAEQFVEEPYEERGTIINEHGVGPGALMVHAGRSLEQIQRYVRVLTKIATKAAELNARVVWG